MDHMDGFSSYLQIGQFVLTLVIIPVYNKLSTLNEKFHDLDKRTSIIEKDLLKK